jgi:hypothetical protein
VQFARGSTASDPVVADAVIDEPPRRHSPPGQNGNPPTRRSAFGSPQPQRAVTARRRHIANPGSSGDIAADTVDAVAAKANVSISLPMIRAEQQMTQGAGQYSDVRSMPLYRS